MTAHQRWKIGPFANGAYSPTGGHWRVLGLTRTWLPQPPFAQYEWSLFDLFAFRWTSDRGWEWALGRIEFRFISARWRYMAADERRWRKEARKRDAAAKAARVLS